MAITEWHTPIHECQKGEVQREWCYLEPYYFFNGNLKDYADLLKYAYNKKYLQDIHTTSTQYDEFLEKHPICFHPYDIKKGNAPTHQQLREWSSGANTSCDEKHKWDERRSSKRNELGRLAVENMAAQMADDLPYLYECVKQGFQEVDEAVENSKMMGNFTPHQAESGTKGRMHVIDSLLKLTGKDKDYNVNANVDADVKKQTTIQNDKWKELVEAYRSGRTKRQSTN